MTTRRLYDPDHCAACGDFLPCGNSWIKTTDDLDDLPDNLACHLEVECCASGRCEVCTPGFDWGRDGMSDWNGQTVALEWHAASDHAADGVAFGGYLCNCEQVAERLVPLLRARARAAWDEGWVAGCNDQQYGDENARPWTPNPHRAASYAELFIRDEGVGSA